MYNLIFRKAVNLGLVVYWYTDDYYAPTPEELFATLGRLGDVTVVSMGYVYKCLGKFWTRDEVILFKDGNLQSLKQLSYKWFIGHQ